MGRTSDAKEKLLAIAFELIWNNSYNGVSVDQICARADVNKGSFYHFFPSKVDLALAAYEEFWQQKRAGYDRIFSPQVPPLERISQLCRFIYEDQKAMANKCGHVLGCPFGSVGSEICAQEEKLREKTQEIFLRNCKYIESALVDARRDGAIEMHDPAAGARNVSACLLGFLFLAKILNDVEILHDIEPAIMRLIGAKTIAGIARPPEPAPIGESVWLL